MNTLVSMQQEYASQFNRTFFRNEVYWKNWIKNELNQRCYLLHYKNQVSGFMSIGPDKRNCLKLIVKDFFVNQEFFSKDRGKEAFEYLLSYHIKNLANSSEIQQIKREVHILY